MQTLKKSKAAAVALAALLAAAYWLAASGEPAAVAAAPASAASRAALPSGHPLGTIAAGATTASASVADLAALQEQVSALGAELARLRDAADPSAGVTARSDDAAAALRQKNDPALREQAERAAQTLAQHKETAFRAENTDPRWATATATAVRQALAGDAGAEALVARSVECRAQSCRVELDMASAKVHELLPMFALRMAASLGSMAASQTDRADGSTAMVLYLSR
jgi:uncharacterized phage infection (PIP) family protein YhgE